MLHRRARARRARRARTLRMLALAPALAGLLAALSQGSVALALYVRENPELYLRTVRVEGLRRLNELDIVRQAGVTMNDHILLVDTTAIARRLLENPYIRSCEVGRVFPDMLTIRIQERLPEATLLSNNRAFVIDRDGVVLRELQMYEPHRGPLITEVPGLDVIEVGDRIEQPELRRAMEVLDAFEKTEIAQHVTIAEVAARDERDIRMYCDELTFEIRWGGSDLPRQAARLDVLWRHQNGRMEFTQYCDLRFGREVACR